jgi:hypothetical protein
MASKNDENGKGEERIEGGSEEERIEQDGRQSI